MNKIKIGLDCDGVLLDFLSDARAIIAKIKNQTATEKMGVWNLEERFSLNKNEVKFLLQNIDWENLKALNHFSELLNYLYHHENVGIDNVFFITMLDKENHEKRIHNLMRLSQQNHLPFKSENVYFTEMGQSKAVTIEKLGIDIFVEDNLNNLFDVSHCQTLKHLIWTESNGERNLTGFDFKNPNSDCLNIELDYNKTVQDVHNLIINNQIEFNYVEHNQLFSLIQNILTKVYK